MIGTITGICAPIRCLMNQQVSTSGCLAQYTRICSSVVMISLRYSVIFLLFLSLSSGGIDHLYSLRMSLRAYFSIKYVPPFLVCAKHSVGRFYSHVEIMNYPDTGYSGSEPYRFYDCDTIKPDNSNWKTEFWIKKEREIVIPRYSGIREIP